MAASQILRLYFFFLFYIYKPVRTNSVVKILSPVSRHVKFILPTLTHAVEECKNKKREEGGKKEEISQQKGK